METTISIMLGKGYTNHNARTFKPNNVDDKRTKYNIEYRRENLKDVYHELFDKALEEYNNKQTRADRKIADYLEKITRSKQEKPYHEAVIQIGNREDMSALEYDSAVLARDILDDYYQGFEKRNPNLRVFSAHLHMDEATPHLHIDFIPFTTNSKRGLETRVSLKKALYQQGFKGTGKADTEWAAWVNNEKLFLAKSMEKYNVKWSQKGTHNEHLSVVEYKKKQREIELDELNENISSKEEELSKLEEKVDDLSKGFEKLDDFDKIINEGNINGLDNPQPFMSAKSYKTKVVDPFIKKLKSIVIEAIIIAKEAVKDLNDALAKIELERKQYQPTLYENERLKYKISDLEKQNSYLVKDCEYLERENKTLRQELKDFKILVKVLGKKSVEEILNRVKTHKNREIGR